MWDKNERDGKVAQAKGRVKQAVGALTGNDRLKESGRADEAVGKAEASVGQISRKAREASRRVAKAVTR